MGIKLVLVKPPEYSPYSFGTFSMGVLAAAVRDIADISIIDATGLTVEKAVEQVASLKPDMVGITLMGSPSIQAGVDFIREFRRHEKVAIIAGGHGASMTPEPLLDAGADCAVVGEGENTLREILETGIRPGMPGTVMRKNGDIIRGEFRALVQRLDDLNPPARDLMPSPPNAMHLMETSRGCPHSCEFCETTRFYGKRWRSHSPERVVREVRRLLDEYNGWMIHISDDNFTASTQRIKKICRQLIDEEVLPAYFMFSARADDLVSDPELLPLMAEARMLRITVGIDTLDFDVGQAVRKTVSPEIYREAFERMREVGIFSIASLIVGLPGETPEAREKAVERAVWVGPDSAQFLPYLPLPGLPREERHTGFEPHPDDIRDAAEFTRSYIMTPSIRERLEKMAQSQDIQGQLARGTLKNNLMRQDRQARFLF